MPDSLKICLEVALADSLADDFDPAKKRIVIEEEVTGITQWDHTTIAAAPAPSPNTYGTGHFSTIKRMIVQNLSARSITMAYDAASGATEEVIKAGATVILGDVDPSTDPTFEGLATDQVEILVVGT